MRLQKILALARVAIGSTVVDPKPAEAVFPLKRRNKGRRLGAPSKAEEKTVQLYLTQ